MESNGAEVGERLVASLTLLLCSPRAALALGRGSAPVAADLVALPLLAKG